MIAGIFFVIEPERYDYISDFFEVTMKEGVADLLFIGMDGVIYGFFTADEDEQFFGTGHTGIEQVSLLHNEMLTGKKHNDDLELTAL